MQRPGRETRNERGTFWELIDFFESERKIGRSIWGIRPLLGRKNVRYLRKLPTNPLFRFSCITRNVGLATASRVITDVMGE